MSECVKVIFFVKICLRTHVDEVVEIRILVDNFTICIPKNTFYPPPRIRIYLNSRA